MPLGMEVKVDTTKVEQTIGKAIPDSLDASKPGPYQDGFRQASAMYLGFIRRRFKDASRGNGTWPDLATSTKLARARAHQPAGRNKKAQAARRAAKKAGDKAWRLVGRVFSILYDTGNLFASLSEGGKDFVQDWSPDGVTVGTANEIAQYHQAGSSKLPKRAILVDPPSDLSDRMMVRIAEGAKTAINQATGGTGG